MKFLIDVNTSRTLGESLQKLDYDVAFVRDKDARMKDIDILQWAVQENRIIITTDNDFEQIVWVQKKQHCGIIRLENLPRSQRQILLDEVLKNYIKELQSGFIIIASLNKFRVRKFL
jgi:predicted nuclease of predicted toxin-antitoxin system